MLDMDGVSCQKSSCACVRLRIVFATAYDSYAVESL